MKRRDLALIAWIAFWIALAVYASLKSVGA